MTEHHDSSPADPVNVSNDPEEVRKVHELSRYAFPAELDLMAQLAGLEPVRRVADWHGRPFTGESESAVSVWRKPA